MYFGIPSSAGWQSVEPVRKGWSNDQKFRVTTQSGDNLLLRLSDKSQYSIKKKEYDIIAKYAKTGISMSAPIEFSICDHGKNVYMLLSWLEGCDLETVLPELPTPAQYRLGREAGGILRTIHSIPVDAEDIPAETKKAKKLRQLSAYEESSVRISGDEAAVQYVKDNIDAIGIAQPVYQHGDFHPGNLIYLNDGSIGVIDFNRWEVGDPYEEFYKLESFGVELSIPYCVGQIDAYFDDAVPDDFWKALAVYVAHASLYSIKWAEKFGQKDIDGMVRRCRSALAHYDHFQQYTPSWYMDEYRKQWIASSAR